MILFGTCGRGLENFAKEELQEIKDVCHANIIAEGKILFCVCSPFQDAEDPTSCRPISDGGSTKSIRNCLADHLPLNNFCQEKFALSLENLSKITSVMNLKLMEKLFIVLYYDVIKSVSEIKNSLEKITEALLYIPYEKVTDAVTQIKKITESPPWRGCSSPTTCDAFILRRLEKEMRVNRKRKCADVDDVTLSNASQPLFAKSTVKVGERIRPAAQCVAASDRAETVTKDNLKGKKTLLVSCRIRGKWKRFLKPYPFSKSVASVILKRNETWSQVTEKADLNLYINLNNECIIVGASLTDHPLSLRPYIPHITLRSTICHLMIRQAKITEGLTVLDPMAGAGTILLEAAINIKNLRIIANEIDLRQLSAARCNLRHLNNVEFILSDAAKLPLRDKCVDALVCDFPFGKKHSVASYEELMPKVLKECIRVLRSNSRFVLLVSAQQQLFLKEFSSENSRLELLGIHPVSLGLTPALVFTFELL